MIQPLQFFERCVELTTQGGPFAIVTLVEAEGSTPQDAGSRMLVTSGGLELGTVGGGKVEARAIEEARQLLEEGRPGLLVRWNLKTDVGMTCGGRVTLYFETVNAHTWSLAIFGAGHVTQSLARLLVNLPCRVTCIDPRPEWLARLPAGIETRCVDRPEEELDKLGDSTFVLCMTRGHASDLPILEKIYRDRRPFPYVGVIGSRAKAATLRRELSEAGIPLDVATFRCPVGLPLGTNHPGEIAVSIAAQLLEVRGTP